jgi:hypothetical protein
MSFIIKDSFFENTLISWIVIRRLGAGKLVIGFIRLPAKIRTTVLSYSMREAVNQASQFFCLCPLNADWVLWLMMSLSIKQRGSPASQLWFAGKNGHLKILTLDLSGK